MKNTRTLVLLLAILCSCSAGFSQYANLEFVENKGQWNSKVKFRGLLNNGAFFLEEKGFTVVKNNDEDMQALSDYLHGHTHETKQPAERTDHTGKDDFGKRLEDTGNKKLVVRSHAYKVEFVNAGTPTLIPDKVISTYNNYFLGNDPTKWAADCKIFQAITYQNIYPNVDLRYYTDNGNVKYDFIVRPGADLSRIALKYEGADGLQIKNEELVVKTSVGENKQLSPYSYQVIDGVKKEVNVRFKISGNLVQFNTADYAKDQTLIIDPILIFSTFSGSTADNWGYTATYGPDGSLYAGGTVSGAGFPVSTGAYQTTFQGGIAAGEEPWDMGIIKFNTTGTTRVYATFIGGNGQDYPHSLVVDAQGNLVIAGRTNSPNYPGTLIGTGGEYDIAVTKLNANGNALIGSLRIGGSKDDGVNIRPKYTGTTGASSIRRNYGDDSRSEVILDGSGNILVASCSQSTNFPSTAASFQPNFVGGGLDPQRPQDGVLLKISPNATGVIFASFLGGDGDDAAFVLAINPTNGNIYVGGNTTSGTFPGDKSGTVNPTFVGGLSDGFVAIVNPAGTSLIKSTFIGTSGIDMLYGIQFDRFGFPYVMGTTTGTWPIINAAYSVPSGRQFIAKLQPNLSAYIYSTVFGGSIASLSPNLSPVAFLVDRCENVYVSGWGGSINNFQTPGYPNAGTTGLPVTPDALQAQTDGSDFYFFVLERNATRQIFGSFFGQQGGSGEHVDGGTSRFDKDGIIYQALCANCGRDVRFPTSPGVWAPTNGSSNCNLAAVKIAFNLAGIGNSIQSAINGVPRKTSGCVPLTVDFKDTIAEGKTYIWNFGDASAEQTTTTPNISHTYNAIGNYSVRLVSIDSASCNISDTAFTVITVRNDEAVLSYTANKVGSCASSTYQFTNTSTAPTGLSYSNQAFKWSFGDNSASEVRNINAFTHTFPGPGTYRVSMLLLDTNFCNAPDSVVKTIRIAANVKAAFTVPPSGCAPFTAVFNNTSAGGESFFWNFGDGSTSNQQTPNHVYTTPGTYNITLVATDTSTCNVTDTARFTIVISDKPLSSFNYSPKPPQENTPVIFQNTAIGAIRYKWLFGDGDTLNTTSQANITHIYNETKKYNACLVAINQYGCADTACTDIQALVVPVLDVPNAFTPNGDGVNDLVMVRGYGIAKLNWRIYNRWGALVFQTIDRRLGWDGRYKGAIQPKEVYHYVLDVEFSDGTRYQKKGDITLL